MAGTRRALILAGGGMKVAFQAGVLQVWLDEAGVTFSHVDAASGGVFNAAMYAQGLRGTEIADRWRSFRPLDAASVNWRRPQRSLFTLDSLRDRVFTKWGLDWRAIHETDRDVTFNVYNFTQQRLETIAPADLTPDLLTAAVALPMWFPPVRVGGDDYIDAVFATDANLEDAIARGADELWVVWTVSTAGRWRNGFVNQYFQIIEAAANANFRRSLARIAAGEFGRSIEVRTLSAEVPLHYLVGFSSARFGEAVELGVRAARTWCGDQGISLAPPAAPDLPPTPALDRVSLRFREPCGGELAFPDGQRFRLDARLQMAVDDVDVFIRNPDHELRCSGELTCEALGGRLAITHGRVRLNVDGGAPDRKRMLYLLQFRDSAGHPLTLLAEKRVTNESGPDLWPDTTTFFTRIVPGHVGFDPDVAPDRLVADGTLRISLRQFVGSLLTYRPRAATRRKAIAGQVRFMRSFVGKLWDVYASAWHTYSPL